jgi:hypothetical protein
MAQKRTPSYLNVVDSSNKYAESRQEIKARLVVCEALAVLGLLGLAFAVL